ncbi:riboflavin synthase [Knoellia sp. Soil729]|uniref:riboflavin synthase n=1 Tax=Knoellia sp. Soil729 TaxID=1736394 RepID=UPI0006FA8483|nr:riboflavin synthase [Knoellia sp. Soil729]KRE41279.1 riboflavin synthase subunit alpha [Knoellia sp. Soil729]
MFTGIVEELGRVEHLDLGETSARLTLRGPLVTSDAVHGASISVNGVCLTVVDPEVTGDTFTVDVMAETLSRTGLGALFPGAPVNLERAMAAAGRFGGHIVQGHVDGTATVVERVPGDRWEVVTFSLPQALARYVVEKGSITVDGVSLTVSAVAATTFSVSLIPTTLEQTTLGQRAVGDTVNLEVDVLAKYVERMLSTRTSTTEVPQ